MKKTLLYFFLVALSSSAFAQITVTNSTFPAAGDTLKTRTTGPTNAITVNSSGQNVNWNFETLLEGTSTQVVFKPASEGINSASFPNAELLKVNVGTDLTEEYYDISGNDFSNMGYSGVDPIGLGVPILPVYNPPLFERYAMTYQATKSGSSLISIPFDAAILPDTLLSSLPIQPDSFKVDINFNRTDNVDAWGTVTIYNGVYPVLRTKRTTITNTSVKAKVPLFGWIDASPFLTGIPQIADALGADTTVSYQFYNNIKKEVIVSFNENTDPTIPFSTLSVEYKDDFSTVSISEVSDEEFQLFPTIVTNQITANLNTQKDIYSFALVNMNGEVVLNQKLTNGQNTFSTITYPSGSYVAYLMDGFGRIVRNEKLVVVR